MKKKILTLGVLMIMIVSSSCSLNKDDTKTLIISGIGISINESLLDGYRNRNPDINLVINDYQKYGSEAVNRLNIDITRNEAGDILFSSGNIDLDSLAEKGTFLNLEPFLDLKNQIIPSVFNSIKKPDGSIYYVYPEFYLEFFLAKSKFINDDEWNREDIISLLKRFSQSGMDVFGQHSDIKMSLIISECIMEDVKNNVFEENKNFYIDLIDVCRSLYAINNETNTDYNDEYIYYNDKVICKSEVIFSFDDIFYNEKGYFGDDISILGNINAQNEIQMRVGEFFSVFKNTENENEAVDFVKQIYEDEYQMHIVYDGMSFPVSEKAFSEMEKSTLSMYGIDENREKKHYICYMNDDPLDIGYPGKEWIQPYSEMIRNHGYISFNDTNMRSVIADALSMIWNSAEAEIVPTEKKIKLYLSEIS